MTYKVISLFTGAGGMDVGFEKAGFDIVTAFEVDTHACNTYKYNNPSVNVIEGDVEHPNIFKKIIEHKSIDVIIGGPPCQGFSVAGKMDKNDPRSKLVFTFCSVVEKIQPKAFIMENVKSLASLAKFKDVRDEIMNRMTEAGYQVSMQVLNAKDFGVPQSRERVFFIGTKQDYLLVDSLNFEPYKKDAISLKEAIGHLGKAGSKNNPNITKAKITLAKKPILRKSPYAGMLFNGQGRPLNPDSWSSTLPASMGGNRTPIIDEEHLYDGKDSWVEAHHKSLLNGEKKSEYGDAPKRLRRLTIDEAAILQSFPPEYKFLGPQSRIFSQIGNAVPCQLAEVVGQIVFAVLSETDSKMK